jgi:hypothetical protein
MSLTTVFVGEISVSVEVIGGGSLTAAETVGVLERFAGAGSAGLQARGERAMSKRRIAKGELKILVLRSVV